MNPDKTKLKEIFLDGEERSCRQHCLRASIFGAVFMLVGVSLDLVVYPEYVTEIFYNRLLTALLLLGTGYLVLADIEAVIARIILHIVAILPLASISYMIYHTEGAQSPYYAGLNLVLVGATLLLRWGTVDSALNVLFCLLLYALALFQRGSNLYDAFIPCYFIFVTGAIATTGTFFTNQARFREFCLAREVQETNKKLEVTNQQLRAIDETKSRFFANLSHELRTPLTLILGPAENLKKILEDDKNPLCEEYLETIEENGYRLLRLINDILDLVKLDSGEAPPRNEAVEVAPFVDGMISNLKPIATMKEVSVSSLTNVSECPVVWIDRDRLEKIILNLAINAVKFTEAEGRIVITARASEGRLYLEVQDTGQGMSQEDVDNVFVRFWQADMSAKRKHRGAGIGLSLVKSLTESMNGEVSVRSELGKGSTFIVELPAIKPPKGESQEEERVRDVLEQFNEEARKRTDALSMRRSVQSEDHVGSKVVPREQETGARKTVLVADDEEAMRHFITRQLEDYILIEARDGGEAWKLAEEHRPDLIILDLMMPVMDGIEVTEKIRRDENLARIPVILITAQASEAPRLEALKAGVNDFISKPFSTVELEVRAKNLLHSAEFENKLAENNVELESAYKILKEQESLLVQTEKLSSLGKMSAGIVHEVNNPLNYTKTALHALGSFKGMLPEDERDDYLDVLGDAKEGVLRVIGIVSDLRSFTRGDAAIMEPVSVKDLVESARRLSSSAMSGMKFAVEIPENIQVMGNEGQLCQLLVNLFQNAVRAIEMSERDRSEGEITVHAIEHDDGEVTLTVRDNGCGIPDDVLPHIFDPFYTRNDVGEGMGLGLSICHRIMDQHHATVKVESEINQYAQFTLRFPSPEKKLTV